MQIVRYPLAIALCILPIHAALGISGESDSQTEKQKTDKYGDPLPKGAVARIGTVRLLHPGVATVAISPDGKLVASADHLGVMKDAKKWSTMVHIWNAVNGKKLHTLAGIPGQKVRRVRFAPDNRYLAVACDDKILVWEIQSWNQIRRWNPGGAVYQLRFDNNRLISVHASHVRCSAANAKMHTSAPHSSAVVGIWDVRAGKKLPSPISVKSSAQQFKGMIRNMIRAAVVSANGRFAALYMSDARPSFDKDSKVIWHYTKERVRIVKLVGGKIVSELKRKNIGHFVALSADATMAAITSNEKIWVMNTENGNTELIVGKLKQEIHHIAFMGNTNNLAVYLRNDDELQKGDFLTWNARTRQRLGRYKLEARDLDFSRDGRLMVATHGDMIRVRSAQTGAIANDLPEPNWSFFVGFPYDSPNIFISENGAATSHWEIGTWRLKRSIPFSEQPQALSFSDARKRIGIIRNGNQLFVKDHVANRIVRQLHGEFRSEPTGLFSPKGKYVAIRRPSAGAVDGVQNKWFDLPYDVFEIGTGKRLMSIKPGARKQILFALQSPFAFSDDDRYVAVPGARLEIFELAGGTKMSAIAMDSKLIHFIGFSTDSRYLFGVVDRITKERAVQFVAAVWDAKTGRSVREMVVGFSVTSGFTLFEPGVTAVALSPTKRTLAVANSTTESIQIWEVASGKLLAALKGHRDYIIGLAFSLDGKYLASSSNDGTILIWDLYQPLNSISGMPQLTIQQLPKHWETLTHPNARKVESAIWRTVYSPKISVPFLAQHLCPVPPLDKKRLERLIGELDGGFRGRMKAFAEIQKLGELGLPRLFEESKKKNNLERHRRLAALVKHADHDRIFGNSDRLRLGRALEVLEKIGNADARRLLQHLANGAEAAWLTREAKAALHRMER